VGGREWALVVLSKVEQRLDAVRAVLAGASVVEVAAAVGVSRVSVHAWLRRYSAEGLVGLVDRTHRPRSSPHQSAIRWRCWSLRWAGSIRGGERSGSRMELVRKPPEGLVIPSTATVNRILVRHGLVLQGKRKRSRDCYLRWQRPGPMQLWQLDIVGGVMLVDLVTGVCGKRRWSLGWMITAAAGTRLETASASFILR
jgi:hypothetical protein